MALELWTRDGMLSAHQQKVYLMRTSGETWPLMDFQTESWYLFLSLRMFSHEKVKTYIQSCSKRSLLCLKDPNTTEQYKNSNNSTIPLCLVKTNWQIQSYLCQFKRYRSTVTWADVWPGISMGLVNCSWLLKHSLLYLDCSTCINVCFPS